MENSVTYNIHDTGHLDTPALIVYPSMVKRNIQHLIKMFNNVEQIRPHVKTHKCPQVVQLLLDSDIKKFKCATIAEAEMLAEAGAADVLLAYQPVGPKIERLLKLMMKYPACLFSCLIDNQHIAEQIAEAARANQVQVRCLIDLNVGMNRTGIEPGEDAKTLFSYCNKLPGITIIGLHAYDGHLTDPDVHIRLDQAKSGFAAVQHLADELIAAGFSPLQVVAGSTPTISFYAGQSNVECSPGTFIYWDQHYQNAYPDLSFVQAALVLTRVVSKPTPATACLDLGYKAISSEGELKERVNLFELTGTEFMSQSEEHLIISSETEHLQVGEAVYGVPYHIGRTCNLYETVSVVEGKEITGQWQNTARQRQLRI
jgi:D-serine deaminase-like pyridoxal phosphate-dependent protein